MPIATQLRIHESALANAIWLYARSSRGDLNEANCAAMKV